MENFFHLKCASLWYIRLSLFSNLVTALSVFVKQHRPGDDGKCHHEQPGRARRQDAGAIFQSRWSFVQGSAAVAVLPLGLEVRPVKKPQGSTQQE